MKIIDLTDSYIEYISKKGELAAYVKSYPSLFDHYFKYWADIKKPLAKINRKELKARLILLNDSIGFIESKFNAAGIDISNLKIVLFVGANTSNGHAFRDGDEFIVWLPIETYFSRQLCDIFICHEIGHALHYTCCEDFYFNDKPEKQMVSRQLITEGVATYVTMKIIDVGEGDALWADYLSPEDKEIWLNQCFLERKVLNKFTLDNFYGNDSRVEYFYALHPDDIYRFRAGYYVGLKLIEELAASFDIGLSEILGMPRASMEKLIYEILKDKSAAQIK